VFFRFVQQASLHYYPTDLRGRINMPSMLWTQRKNFGPRSVSGHVLAYDPGRHLTLLYGGADAKGTPLNETWTWDGGAWIQVADMGPPSWGGSIAYFADSKRMLFVGPDHMGVPVGTWDWDGVVWTQLSLTSPLGPMVYDSLHHNAVLFQAPLTAEVHGRTWSWEPALGWVTRDDTGPSQRTSTAMAFDSERNETVLFGGLLYGPATALADTWVWDGSVWHQRSDFGPPARGGHAMTFDTKRKRVVLFGGTVTPPGGAEHRFGDTWEWDGIRWVQLQDIGPPPTSLATALAYDTDRGCVVYVGGDNDTWELAEH
jgi:hypothetical protein